PAASSAWTSACASPKRRCQASPTGTPSRTTTGPTSGFGSAPPPPRSARSRARAIPAPSVSGLAGAPAPPPFSGAGTSKTRHPPPVAPATAVRQEEVADTLALAGVQVAPNRQPKPAAAARAADRHRAAGRQVVQQELGNRAVQRLRDPAGADAPPVAHAD